jgi:hypothetical protein
MGRSASNNKGPANAIVHRSQDSNSLPPDPFPRRGPGWGRIARVTITLPATPSSRDVPLLADAPVGDPSAVTGQDGVVHVFGRDRRGSLSEYRYDPKAGTWTTLTLAPLPATAGFADSNPTAFLDPRLGAGAFVTTGDGHLVRFDSANGTATDLSVLPGWNAGRVYSSVGVAVLGNLVFIAATDQTGGMVRVVVPAGGGSVSAAPLMLPAGIRVFQDVSALAAGGVVHVFGVDEAGELIHLTSGPDGNVLGAEDVTATGQPTAQGYSAYQQPFAGRVLPDVSVLAAPDGTLTVYGTNGRDLVEFRRPPGGTSQIRDLTNALPANRVFGGPAAYLLPDGEIHVLAINEDAEVIEYYRLSGQDFSTQNITLALGNSGSPPHFPATGSASPGNTGPPRPTARPRAARKPMDAISPVASTIRPSRAVGRRRNIGRSSESLRIP